MNKMLKRMRRRHFVKILSIFFVVFLFVSAGYAVMTYRQTHNMLYRLNEERSEHFNYEIRRHSSDPDRLNYVINERRFGSELLVKYNGKVIAKTVNQLPVNFENKDTGFHDYCFIDFKKFRSMMSDKVYGEICDYLNTKLDNGMKYELLCRKYYLDNDMIYPRTLALVKTSPDNNNYSKDEAVKKYKFIDPELEKGSIYISGRYIRNPIKTEFVLGQYAEKGILKKAQKEYSYEQSKQMEIKSGPFSYIFFSRYNYTRDYTTTDKNRYIGDFAAEYNVLNSCYFNVINAAIVIFLFFSLVGYLISLFSWKGIKAEIENEKRQLELTRAMAHDLKTPIFIISGYLENLRNRTNPEKREHYYDVIVKQTAIMNTAVHNMLDYSGFASGEFSIKREKVNFSDFLSSVTSAYPGDRLEIDIEPKVEISIDKNLIRTVLTNFLDNAFKYGREDENVEVTLKKDKLIITNGFERDLAPKELEEIWKPYVKLDASRISEGNGLGLSICDRILELHGFRHQCLSENKKVSFVVHFR